MQRRRYGIQKNPVRGVSRKDHVVNRWQGNIIPYTLSSDYSDEQKKIIRLSLDSLEQISCFRFVPRSDEKDFLAFMPLDGCYSYVGKVGGTQVISLAVDCIADYIIWHEVMHAIGFEHEHQRPDRDQFIKVEYSNVQQGQLVNFEKLAPHEVDYPDDYDYQSIMHYDSHAFGRRDPVTNARLATMIPLKVGVLSEHLKTIANIQSYSESDGAIFQNGLCSTSSTHLQAMLKYCQKTCRLFSMIQLRASVPYNISRLSMMLQDPRCDKYARNGFCTDPFYERIRAKKCMKTCNLCISFKESE
ncbi:unnamed protein product [Haemonchus placei]|uniref:Metalloendopeptidase n=1 Tax=Haemonchus placei TaxID=6290 RepID=A0A3P8AJU8_HAEPC|nr:unnamed protein product [Haemonchus placei]